MALEFTNEQTGIAPPPDGLIAPIRSDVRRFVRPLLLFSAKRAPGREAMHYKRKQIAEGYARSSH
jgi:hypothetical protein